MAQVPFRIYLIIGDGRLANHLSFYFKNKGISFKTWNRKKEDQKSLHKKIKTCDFSLLCLPDNQILPFWKSSGLFKTPEKIKPSNHNQQAIHFSGSFFHPDILGFHPLMTFDLRTYKMETYEKIPFVGIYEPEIFKKVFPGLENPYLKIKKEEQALYHSLCVLSGNGTTLLWDLVGRQFARIGINNQHLKPYLEKTFENISSQTRGRWSGPWYREDIKTIEKNKKSLNENSLKKIYESFFELSKQAEHFHEQRP